MAKVGFIKETPLENIKEFIPYYKNSLIILFWRSALSSIMKGCIVQISTIFWKCKSHIVTYGHNNEVVTNKSPLDNIQEGPNNIILGDRRQR